jgi:hypothetical protein
VMFYITGGRQRKSACEVLHHKRFPCISSGFWFISACAVCVHYELVGIELQRNPFEFLLLPNSAAKAAVGELPPPAQSATPYVHELPPSQSVAPSRSCRRPRVSRRPRAGAAGPERRFASTSCRRRPRAPRRTSTSCRRPRASRRPGAAAVPERRAVYELLSPSRAPRVHELMNRPQAARYPHQICLLL